MNMILLLQSTIRVVDGVERAVSMPDVTLYLIKTASHVHVNLASQARALIATVLYRNCILQLVEE